MSLLRTVSLLLLSLRSVLPLGVELSQVSGTKVMLARHVADATTAYGRANLLRLARMALDGGRLYLQVATAPSPDLPYGVRPLDPLFAVHWHLTIRKRTSPRSGAEARA